MQDTATNTEPPAQGRRSHLFATLAVLATGLIFAAAFAAAVIAMRPHQNQRSAVPSGIPASVPTALASLMYLTPVPHQVAPGFTLTDQAGHTVSLASFKGRAVVLEFMDPHCTDICPIVSREFADAYHDLGPVASRVVFAAVNVNAYHHQVADVAAFSRDQHLTSLPSWRFLTGPVASLQAVWRAYHIYVHAPSPNADIVHTSAVYFIDPRGREAFLASPMDDHTKNGTAYLPIAQQAAWGRGIAMVARGLVR